MKRQTVKVLRVLPVVMLVCGLCLMVSACPDKPPLKIGFIGGLTGRVADLGVAGRDGVIFAIEEKNQAGGVAGRQVELVVKDDRQEADSARQGVDELIAERVVAVVGPMTSSMAVVVQPMINAAGMVMISPTVKTDQLSSQDDFFLRVTTPLSRNARQLASHAVGRLNMKKIAVVYDVSNRSFTETWLNYFDEALQQAGGTIVFSEAFTSQPEVQFLPIAERLLLAEPEGVLFLSNAIDTALLAQQIRKLQSPVALFCTEWAFTTDLLSFGGRAVNGMTSFHSFNTDSREARYLAFKDKFTRRFGYAPSFATVLAYDAATFLFSGLEQNPAREGLKEALLKIGSFPGLQSTVTVDRFGDVDRRLFMTVVTDGQFKVVE